MPISPTYRLQDCFLLFQYPEVRQALYWNLIIKAAVKNILTPEFSKP